MSSTATQFNSQTATAAGKIGGSKRGNKSHPTAEIAVGIALRYLVSTVRAKNLPPYVRTSAARTLLSTLHDAGVKPSQRDLAIVFRKLAKDNELDIANDTPATPAAEEKSK